MERKVKCTVCGEVVTINDVNDANICPRCNSAFVTEKAIKLYEQTNPTKKKRHILKSLGKGLLCALECVGYLLYVLTFMWIFFDIVDGKKK